jgi:hypothetical protein
MTTESVAEVWKAIEGFEYEVSNHGRVRSLPRVVNRGFAGKRYMPGKVLRGRNHFGYRTVVLCSEHQRRDTFIHRLVLEAFVGPAPPGRDDCNHKDANKSNNHISNLEWVTRKENINHAIGMDLMIRGSLNGQSKLTEADVKAIREEFAGEPTVALAKYFEVSERTIQDARSRRLWSHVA